ncbi:MAG TPA: flagellar export chaperone FliS [Burkholderiales bacterium]|nr:flagellar export chaperone FliS [Burkholderiales bacterium]
MPLPAQYGINAYAKVGVESGVSAASPHRLILMLLEGAMVAIGDAKRHLLQRNIAAKGMAISKAIMIIDDGLRVSVDLQHGGELAQNLYALYEYMSRRLLLASARNDIAIMDEVKRLLGEIKEAWESIGTREAAQPRSAGYANQARL